MSRGAARPIRTTSRIRLRPAPISRWGRWKNRLRMINWTMWVSVITAIVAVGSLIGTAISIRETSDNAANDRRLQQRGQASDRYLKAVEQLAAPTPDLRLGGIYALDQLYNDSPLDAEQIVAVLLSYVRNRAPVANCPRRSLPTDPKPLINPDDTYDPPADIQASLRVIGRKPIPASEALDMSDLCLRGMDLSRLSLSSADFSNSYASGANFYASNLAHSRFVDANISNSNFSSADLHASVIENAEVSYSEFFFAQMRFARIENSVMHAARFQRADLRDASIRFCEIGGSNFANLRELPAGFVNNRGINATPPSVG